MDDYFEKEIDKIHRLTVDPLVNYFKHGEGSKITIRDFMESYSATANLLETNYSYALKMLEYYKNMLVNVIDFKHKQLTSLADEDFLINFGRQSYNLFALLYLINRNLMYLVSC